MKYECDMIADLLPLYKDGACSEASEKIIKEHLSECEKCSTLLDRMGESEIDEQMIREKDDVISSQAKFFKRKSALAGGIVAAVFAIPILVCLIVNLATGAGLTWFFIVLAAMCIPASLVVVPLMAPEHKFLLSAGAFSASLIMLLGVVSIYTGGSWFFIAASSVLFGLVVGVMNAPNTDMSPNIKAKDLLLYYRMNNSYHAQDIVVLVKNDTTYIGRIVAVGGDSVEISDSEQLIINGNFVSEPEIKNTTPRFEGFVNYPVQLGEIEYFILADARSGAEDSRYYGVVTIQEICGKVVAIIRRNNL